MSTAPFALLDDRHASAEQPSSRLYTGFVREHGCVDPRQLEATCAAVLTDQRAGLFALLLADYEWGARLQGLQGVGGGSLRVLMFSGCARLSGAQVAAWLQAQDGGLDAPGPAGLMDLQETPVPAAGVGGFEDWFDAAVARIHAAIRAGETYQVNLTYPLAGQAYGSPLALYRRLRARQPAPYGALIALPPRLDAQKADEPPRWLLSCSPELFLRLEGGRLTAQPMKGTAPRDLADPAADAARAEWLRRDAKNRAENLMIVDLLRNDLGRIAATGSVRVPQLFEVHPHGAVWQMTSTVQADLAPGVDLASLLRATFPCGSITGAPKQRTMGWIDQLETAPRGLYTGAIGWLDSPPAASGQRSGQGSAGVPACGDLCLSVAIRTLLLGDETSPNSGLRPARLGVGAGIVLDSDAAAERAECRVKAGFVTGMDPGFELFETLWASRAAGPRALAAHLARMCASAAALGFGWDEAAARALLTHTLSQWPDDAPRRLRLALRQDGSLSCSHALLTALPGPQGSAADPVGLILATETVLPADTPPPLLRHKTSLRRAYDAGVRAAEAVGAFDSLFFTTDGWLTEGGRSSVFVRLGGRWVTPPVSEGLLPGVQRAAVLADPAWPAVERRIHRDELAAAEGLLLCNALRGVLHARWLR